MLILYPYCHKIIALKNLVSVSIFEIFHVVTIQRIPMQLLSVLRTDYR